MRSHPGSRTATSCSSPSLWASSTGAWSTSSPRTWTASASGRARSTSGRISSATTVCGWSYRRSSPRGAGRRSRQRFRLTRSRPDDDDDHALFPRHTCCANCAASLYQAQCNACCARTGKPSWPCVVCEKQTCIFAKTVLFYPSLFSHMHASCQGEC
jgi:hypothetical protein